MVGRDPMFSCEMWTSLAKIKIMILSVYFCKLLCSYILLSFNEDAEQQCDEAISAALAIDPNSIDANHALVNIRLSQNKPIDASVLGMFNRTCILNMCLTHSLMFNCFFG